MMEEKITKFRELIGLVADLQYASAVLGWDQETYMPSGGAQDRAMQLSTLNGLAHEKFVSDEVGSLLEELQSGLEEMDPDSDDSRLIIQIGKEFDKQSKIPNQWVAEFSKTTSLAQQNWKAARTESDFQKFQPDLERVIDMRKEYTEFFKPYDHIYDPLLDDFESGMKTAEVKKVFDDLRPKQVDLIQAVMESGTPVNDAIIHQEFDEQKQWDFGIEVIKAFGYDLERGRQDRSTHPFTTSFGSGDVRITTRIYPDFLSSGLFSTLHEAGHGMYGQGVDPKLSRTLIADGASLGLHESQSRMWENLVGRSRYFWVAFLPRLKELFPSQLGNVEVDEFG
jgi:carboxypeptidase Taq